MLVSYYNSFPLENYFLDGDDGDSGKRSITHFNWYAEMLRIHFADR